MDTFVKCPYCGSLHTAKTKNGTLSRRAAAVGGLVGGTMLQMLTGVPGILGMNAAMRRTWHQFCCHECHEVFKVRLGIAGQAEEIKKY